MVHKYGFKFTLKLQLVNMVLTNFMNILKKVYIRIFFFKIINYFDFKLGNWGMKMVQTVIVRNEGFRRLEITNGSSNWKRNQNRQKAIGSRNWNLQIAKREDL